MLCSDPSEGRGGEQKLPCHVWGGLSLRGARHRPEASSKQHGLQSARLGRSGRLFMRPPQMPINQMVGAAPLRLGAAAAQVWGERRAGVCLLPL